MALRVRPESKFGGPGDTQVTRHEKGKVMADLIAIGYPDETTAFEAADDARRLAAAALTITRPFQERR